MNTCILNQNHLSLALIITNDHKKHKLEKSGKLQRLTLSDFLNGTTHREGRCHINQDFYTSKSFLVVV